MISEATGRNALFKIHVSLGKIVNTLKEKDEEVAGLTLNLKGSVGSVISRKSSVAPSAAGEDKSVVDEDKSVLTTVEGEEDGEEDERTVIADPTPKTRRSQTRDSLVSELLSDEDVDMSGV